MSVQALVASVNEIALQAALVLHKLRQALKLAAYISVVCFFTRRDGEATIEYPQ